MINQTSAFTYIQLSAEKIKLEYKLEKCFNTCPAENRYYPILKQCRSRAAGFYQSHPNSICTIFHAASESTILKSH